MFHVSWAGFWSCDLTRGATRYAFSTFLQRTPETSGTMEQVYDLAVKVGTFEFTAHRLLIAGIIRIAKLQENAPPGSETVPGHRTVFKHSGPIAAQQLPCAQMKSSLVPTARRVCEKPFLHRRASECRAVRQGPGPNPRCHGQL